MRIVYDRFHHATEPIPLPFVNMPHVVDDPRGREHVLSVRAYLQGRADERRWWEEDHDCLKGAPWPW